jgi:hypothetical protein
MTHRQHGRVSRPTTLDELEGHVPTTFIEGAKAASDAFRSQGIKHVLIGGLAVGINGYPRPTRDIDFLVDDNAFEFHGPIVTHRPGLPISYKGIGIDWVSLEPNERSALAEFMILPFPNDVPVMPVEPLIAMKLLVGRQKDRSDIVEMIKAGVDIQSCLAFAERAFPKTVTLLTRLIKQAEIEQ